MTDTIKSKVSQAMNALASAAYVKTTLHANEVDFWLDNYSDTLFCNGKLRQVVFEKITDKTYKIYTKEI